ncbi:sensor of ECF-type sigma factor [Flavobacterium sp.]|uniref:sensor of ECF-type sigma factor n=1 Tax=Flavobacterium sp. TaxID=239 RepID=UPI0025F0D4C5|nr:sensor of ECF-type sigma factor [Flavobacterium sp.]
MKINKIITLLSVIISLNALAQDGSFLRKKKEQIRAIKIGFITNELDLTPDEATKFWPLFNGFEDKQQEIKKIRLKGYLERLDDDALDKLSDKDASTMLTQMESSEDELYQAKKKFVLSLKGVIAPIKILKLKRAEENFNKKLLQQYRNKKLGR